MYLLVALRAVGVEHGAHPIQIVNVRSPYTKVARWRSAMSGVTSQTQERCRLMQQVVGDRAVRIVADAAILFDRCVLMYERALLLCVTFVAGAPQFHCRCR